MKKLILVITILLGIGLGSYFFICMSYEKQINDIMEEAAKKGQITLPEEIMKEVEGLPEKDNRFPIYLEAYEEAKKSSDNRENFRLRDDLKDTDTVIDYYEKNKKDIQKELKMRENVFVILDKLSTKKDCNFNMDYKQGLGIIEPTFPNLLAKILTFKALEDIDNKNYENAIGKCLTILTLSEDLRKIHTVSSYRASIDIANQELIVIEYMVENKVKANYAPLFQELNKMKEILNKDFIKSLEVQRALGVSSYNQALKTGEFLEFSLGPKFKQKFYILKNELEYVKYFSTFIDELYKNPLADLSSFPEPERPIEWDINDYLFHSLPYSMGMSVQDTRQLQLEFQKKNDKIIDELNKLKK